MYKNVKIINIKSNFIGISIYNYLKKKIENLPRSKIFKIIRKGEIRINKKRVNYKYKIKKRDKIRIPPLLNIKKNKKIIIKKKKIKLLLKLIIFEDNDIIVFNKPSGLSVHGGSKIKFGLIEILRFLRKDIKYMELVHRLDKYTSGILLIAKNRNSLCTLQKQIREKKIIKEYIALLHGRLSKKINIINTPIFIKKKIEKKTIFLKKESKTYFKILKFYRKFTLVKIKPITGRKHQIRIHALLLGHPILNDKKYNYKIKKKKIKNRIFLHAKSLFFKHPIKNNLLFFKISIEKKLKNFLIKLK